jgi:hypothetical protein
MASRRGETRRLEELDGRHNIIIIAVLFLTLGYRARERIAVAL